MAVYKDKKTNTWYFRTYVFDPLKQERVQKTRKGFKLKRDAQEAEAVFIAEYENKKYSYKNITFNYVVNEFLKFTEKRVKATTLNHYKNMIKNHIFPFLKNLKCERINRDHISRWYDYLDSLDFSADHKNRILKTTISVFEFAERNYDIKIRYIYELPPFQKKSTEKKRKRQIYSPEEFQRFIKGANDLEKVMFTTLFFTGVRIGELRGLKWIDYDYKNQVLQIKRQINSKMGLGNIEINPKTKNSIRKIWLPDKTNDLLNQWYKRKSKVISFDKSWYIFGDLTPLAETTITRWKNNLADKNGLHRITLHEFRHSYTTMLFYSDISPEVAKELLGHNSIATTLDIYTHLSEDTIADEVKNKLNK